VTSILNPENLGYGAAANQGITASQTPYVMLLNVDTEMKAGCIDQLEHFLESDPEVAVAAPQLLYANGTIQPSCRRFPTVLRYFLFLSGIDRLIPSGYRISKRKHKSSMEVDQPMGAALLFRKAVLDQVGLFDPQFFMYMEEVDLCERIKKNGWKIHFLAEAKAIHHAGGSSDQDWERSQVHYFTSIIRYFRKRESSRFAFRTRRSHPAISRSFVVGRFHGQSSISPCRKDFLVPGFNKQ
jgi:GT2 family glycosyltransferase